MEATTFQNALIRTKPHIFEKFIVGHPLSYVWLYVTIGRQA